jgi:hypothetical protein
MFLHYKTICKPTLFLWMNTLPKTSTFLKICWIHYILYDYHRNQSINRNGTYTLADVLAMDNSTVGAATRLFADFLWSNIYRGDKKFYFLEKLYITKPYHDHRSVYYRDSSLKLIIWVVALVSDRNGPCRGCLLIFSIGPFSINTLISMMIIR